MRVGPASSVGCPPLTTPFHPHTLRLQTPSHQPGHPSPLPPTQPSSRFQIRPPRSNYTPAAATHGPFRFLHTPTHTQTPTQQQPPTWSPVSSGPVGPIWNSHCPGITSALMPLMMRPACRQAGGVDFLRSGVTGQSPKVKGHRLQCKRGASQAVGKLHDAHITIKNKPHTTTTPSHAPHTIPPFHYPLPPPAHPPHTP